MALLFRILAIGVKPRILRVRNAFFLTAGVFFLCAFGVPHHGRVSATALAQPKIF